tara:strand:- start:196 stop:609 length:414 start_codon:yes stop_codon:yes gene_type:complete
MKAFYVLFLCSISLGIMAQGSSLKVVNNTNCSFIIKATAYDSLCEESCQSGIYCVMPNDSIYLPPCQDSTFKWDVVKISPGANDCESEPCSGGDQPTLSSPYSHGCKEFATTVTDAEHCAGCNFSASFFGPYILRIH